MPSTPINWPPAPVTPAAFPEPGVYDVRVSAHDTHLSGSDELRVNVFKPECTEPAEGVLSWWPLDGDAYDAIGTDHGQLRGDPPVVAGVSGLAYGFDGFTDSLVVPASPGLAPTSFTIEGWVYPGSATARQPILQVATAPVSGVELWVNQHLGGILMPGALFANVRDEAGLDHGLATPPGLLPLGTWTHVALAYDQATGRARLHVNGREVAAEDLGTFAPWTGLNLNFGWAPVGSRRFTGRLDELAVYGRALEAGEIEAVFLAGGRGKCRPRNEAPSVSAGDEPGAVPAPEDGDPGGSGGGRRS